MGQAAARLLGKTYLVTGAHTEVGAATVALIRRFNGNIILTTPSLEQLSQAKQAVSSMGSTLFKPGEASPLKVDGFVLDCAGTHRSFSNFVDAIGSLNVKLDGVLFNDEVLESKYVETSLGLERMLHYNYYSRFVLGNLLIDHLQPNGLIVNSVPESMRIGDTQYLYDSDRPREEFDPLRTYAAVACANGVFTSQLASRLALEEDCSNMWSYASVTPHAVKRALVDGPPKGRFYSWMYRGLVDNCAMTQARLLERNPFIAGGPVMSLASKWRHNDEFQKQRDKDNDRLWEFSMGLMQKGQVDTFQREWDDREQQMEEALERAAASDASKAGHEGATTQ